MAGRHGGHSEARAPRLALAGWVLFDWAAQPFFSLIQSFGYAPFFVRAVVGDPVAGQAYWGYATAAAALLIALLSPTLGAVMDQMGHRKRWILACGALYALGCSMLWFGRPGEPGAVAVALVAFVLAAVAIEIATAVNNAMLPGLASRARIGRLSGLGAALGNIGGVVAIALMVTLLLADPRTGRTLIGIAPILGLDGATQEGARAVGPFAALWFGVFVLPMLLFTPDIRAPARGVATLKQSLLTLRATLRELPAHPNMLRFLIANMIYTDGLVAFLALGGILASGTLGWSPAQVGLFGILVTVSGIGGALLGGALVDRLGAKTVVLVALALMMVALVGILSVRPGQIGPFPVELPQPGRTLFDSAAERAQLSIGALIGVAFGAILASARIILVQLAPPDRLTQFFGLFALSGRITAFLGPLCVAVATQLLASQRAGIAVLLVFFALGMGLLLTVRTR